MFRSTEGELKLSCTGNFFCGGGVIAFDLLISKNFGDYLERDGFNWKQGGHQWSGRAHVLHIPHKADVTDL